MYTDTVKLSDACGFVAHKNNIGVGVLLIDTNQGRNSYSSTIYTQKSQPTNRLNYKPINQFVSDNAVLYVDISFCKLVPGFRLRVFHG